MRREIHGQGLGSARLLPENKVVAGAPCDWEIVYTCGPRGISKGGCIRFDIPYGFSMPQIVFPSQVAYTTARCSNAGVAVTLTLTDPAGKCRNQGVFAVHTFVTINNDLLPGDTVTLHYGKGVRGGFTNVGAFARYFEGEAEFTVLVDPDGTRSAPHGGFSLIDDPQPRVTLAGGKADHLFAVTPSILRPGETLEARYTVRDRLDNTATDFAGTVSLHTSAGVNETSVLKSSDRVHGTVKGLSAGNETIVRVTAETEDPRVRGTSNPTLVAPESKMPRLYWGDTHIMTEISAGLGRPSSALEYGRDKSHLDFCALTDGDDADGYFTEEEWIETKDAIRRFYEPGRFVTILASEFHERRHAGDKNIYYRVDEHDLLRWSDLGPDQPGALWDRLRGEKAMTIPHHPVSGSAGLRPWDYYDPDYQRLVEVYSIWGNSECEGAPRPNYWHNNYNNSVQAGLAKGYRMGLIASGDSHDGLPGNASWMRLRQGYRGGLAAVYAHELTREAVFDALWDRFCYGTTGARIILWYTLNNARMGQELSGEDHRKRRTIQVRAIGTAPISRVVVIRNGAKAHDHAGSGMEEQFEFLDTEPFENVCLTDYAGKPFVYYYIRVEQADGEIAWSSPVWVS